MAALSRSRVHSARSSRGREWAVAAIGAGLLITGCSSGGDVSPTADPTIGGTAVCDEPSISAVIREEVDETYPGATFVSLETFECVDGWASARAAVDTNGVVVTTAFYLQAEGQFWVPVPIEEICSTPLEESLAPEQIYLEACGTPE